MKKVCEHCSGEYEAGDNGMARLKRYCGPVCQRAAQVVRNQAKKYGNVDLSTACVCKQCGRFYKPATRERDTFCSRECAYAHGKVKKLYTCPACGKEHTYKGASHCDIRYCSSQCHTNSTKNVIACSWCGGTFRTNVKKNVYCSSECASKGSSRDKREAYEPLPRRIRSCKRCGKFYTSKGNSRLDKYCSRYCRNKVRSTAQKAKKRMVKHGIVIEPVDYLAIYMRDNASCHICGGYVHKEYDCNDKLSGTLDHVMPLAKGGHHTHENVKLAHMICNSIKGDSVDGKAGKNSCS